MSTTDELRELTEPLIKWLNDEFNAHAIILITTDSAEVLRGETGYVTKQFIHD